MRRKDKQTTPEQALEWLKTGEHGVLSLTDEYGAPYCVPVSYVYYADAIWIHCAIAGRKLECIKANPRACFCVYTCHHTLQEKFSVRYDSVIVSGEVNIVRFAPMVEEVLYELSKKYTGHSDEAIMNAIKKDIDHVCLIRVAVDAIDGKQSK